MSRTGRPNLDINTARARRLVARGLSIRKAAKVMGVHHNTLNRRLRIRARPKTINRQPHTEETKRKMSEIAKARFAAGYRHPKRPEKRAYKEKACERCGQMFRFRFFPSLQRERKYCGRLCWNATLPERARAAPSSDVLYDLYWNQNLIVAEIGARFGVSRSKIDVWMRGLGIPRKKARVRLSHCSIEGCYEPVFNRAHSTTGHIYGRHCVAHWQLHKQRNWTIYNQRVRDRRLMGYTAEVERLVPKELPFEIREDVCSELVVGLLTRNIKLRDLSEVSKTHIKRFYHQSASNRFTLSLDMPLWNDENEGGTLGQGIAAEYA